MEFKIAKETFLKGLQRVQGIVEKRNTMPILSNVLLEATADRLEIIATDLEVGMKSSYPATVSKPGKITVAAKKLFEIIRELPEDQVSLSSRENDWVEIRCGKASFNIIGLSPDEFPYFPTVNDNALVKIGGPLLRDMVEKTSFAICHDETKYNLNGIFVKAEEKEGAALLRMVATDGHRLALTEKQLDGTIGSELARGVILPRKGIMELRKLAEEGEESLLFGFTDNSVVIKRDETVVVMRLVDGEFPDYTRVIPTSNNRDAVIDRPLFLQALKRMAILSSDKSKGVKLEFQAGRLCISSSNPELGEAMEDMDIDFSGEALTIGFNARYLLDVLSVLGDSSITISLKDELSPALITGQESSGFLSVIMPMRL